MILRERAKWISVITFACIIFTGSHYDLPFYTTTAIVGALWLVLEFIANGFHL